MAGSAVFRSFVEDVAAIMTGFPFVGTLTSLAQLLLQDRPADLSQLRPAERLLGFALADRPLVARAWHDYEALANFAGLFRGALAEPTGDIVVTAIRLARRMDAGDVTPDLALAFRAGVEKGWFAKPDPKTMFWIAYEALAESDRITGFPARHLRLRAMAAIAAQEVSPELS